ncbi:hypothetical protein [Pseudonocardia sp. GCM10023141]
MTLDAAARIVGLQDELSSVRARITELESPDDPPPPDRSTPAARD